MVEARLAGSVRERLLQAADELFYREGVHTVGIDRILARAGVAKASLYGTFGSKEELVRAYLEGRARSLQERMESQAATIEDPRQRILAIFDGFVERAKDADYYGCPFVRACAEAPPAPNAARDVSAAYRAWRHAFLARLAKDAGSRDGDATATLLALIYDGAACSVSLDHDPGAALMARRAAERLLDEHARPSARRGARRGPVKRASRAR